MQYMMLIYSQERSSDVVSEEEDTTVRDTHIRLMQEASSKGILLGAGPLAPTSTATTVRMQDGRMMITDGPFAETKEQLAGFYVLECQNLEEAMEWAARIPTGCYGGDGCVEIRPMRTMPKSPEPELNSEPALLRNG